MRARKVVILLALTALSALTLFLVVLADADAFGAESHRPGPDVARAWFGPDRKAEVEVLVILGEGGSGDLRLPLVPRVPCDFTVLSGPTIFHQEGK